MIIDASAILAVLLDEPDARTYADEISGAWPRRMSVIGFLETAIVTESRGGADAGIKFDAFLADASIEIVPVSLDQAYAARDAWRRFGKGRHPARLNFGDCFAYALAKTRGEPLLFKGGDFPRTDIETVAFEPDSAP